MYLRIISGVPTPYSPTDLKRSMPEVSFPRVMSDELLATYDVFPYTRPAVPAHDPATQVVQDGAFVQTNGAWSRGWTVRDKTAEEIAAELAAEQQGMRAFKRAFNYAMTQRAPTATLLGLFPSAATLLEAVDALEQTLDPYHPLRLARRDIIEYIRIHPDVAGFQQVTGLTDAEIDDLFRVAMAYEAA